MDDDRGLILPSPDVTAAVTTAAVPDVPPPALEHCVMAVADERGRIGDWLLDHDAAFGDLEVLAQYARWRSSWESSWPLDSLSSLRTLQALAAGGSDDLGAGASDLLDLDLDRLAEHDDVEIEWRRAPALAKSLTRLRKVLAKRGGEGLGVVDATPGSRRVGLARSFAALETEELVADDDVTVVVAPLEGLVVAARRAGDAVGVRWAGITEVDLSGDLVRIVARGEEVELPRRVGRVLGWVVPGCVHWRVRKVPLAVVWANTFAGIEQGASLAYRSHRPLRLTTSSLATHDG